MTTATKVYGVLIQTDPTSQYQAYVGWDSLCATRADAEARAQRARTKFLDAKVVEMTPEEAAQKGWTE